MKPGVIAIVLSALFAAAPCAASESQTLHGSFVSSYQDRPERLRAVFRPVGEGEWSVVFHFRFAGAEHVYEGVASGSLSDGELVGRAQNENRSRLFTFRGEFEDGRFEGTHFEVVRGEEVKTGTLNLAG